MSKSVMVKVLREHSGDSGHHPEKSEYPTSVQHARQLKAQNLVDFDEADAKDDEPVTEQPATQVSAKAQPAPRNKAEKAPANKAESAPRNKANG